MTTYTVHVPQEKHGVIYRVRAEKKVQTRWADVANPENALLTASLIERDFKPLVQRKVKSDWFADDEIREIFTWALGQLATHGRPPSLALTKREFPDFDPEEPQDDIPVLLEAVGKRKLYADINSLLDKVAKSTRGDPEEGLALLRSKAASIASDHIVSVDLDFTQEGDALWQEYLKLEKGGGMLGTPWPWPRLNKATLGIHAQQFLCFYGRPKAKKTWLLLFLANFLNAVYGMTINVFTKEMSPPELRRRLAVIRAKIDYARYRAAELNRKEKKRFLSMAKKLKNAPPLIISTIGASGPAGVAEVRQKCEESGADACFIDGLIFLSESEDWKDFAAVCNHVKTALAQPLNIPVIATTWANRSGEKSKGKGFSDVAFGDALSMYADVLIRIICDETHVENDEVLLTLPAIREAKRCSLVINTKIAEDFTEKYVPEGEEEDDAITADDGGGIL